MRSPIDHLPQTGPARLIARIAESADDNACYAHVPEDSPFRSLDRSSDTVPALLAIEMAAQAAAVLEPLAEEGIAAAKSPRLLVGMRSVRMTVPVIDANCEYLCKVEAQTTAPPLRIYRFEVSDLSGSLVAEGELSTFFDSDPA